MECLAAFLIFVSVCTAVLVGVGQRISNRRGRRRLFRQLARRFSGQCYPGGLLSPPLVAVRYGETSAVFSEVRDVGPLSGSAFQVRIQWPHAQAACAIVAAAGQGLRRDRLYMWPLVQLDIPKFSENFLVTSPDAHEVRQLLNSGVCWHLERLRQLGTDHRLFVLIQGGQIFVQKFFGRPRGDLPAQFLQGALELYDQCMLARASGIEFLNHHEAHTLDQVTCRVCGESIEEELVYCRRCKTPHHQECWKYAGICSVFGCRETVYLLPQSGKIK